MSAKTKSTKNADPLAQRAELWERLDRAQARQDEVGARYQRAEQALNAAHRELAPARVSEVLGDVEPAEVERLAAQVERLTAEVDQIKVEAEPIDKALRLTSRQIENLHRREVDAFAAAAAPLVEDARARLEELLPALRAAHDAWNAATAEWAPIVRDAGLSYVPAWPIISPGEAAQVLRSVSPAPAEYAPTSTAKSVAPGTLKLWRRRDGMLLQTREGDEHDASIRSERDFSLVAIGRDEVAAIHAAESRR